MNLALKITNLKTIFMLISQVIRHNIHVYFASYSTGPKFKYFMLFCREIFFDGHRLFMSQQYPSFGEYLFLCLYQIHCRRWGAEINKVSSILKKKDTVSVKYLNLSILSAWNLFWIDCGWISSNHSDFILVFLLVYSYWCIGVKRRSRNFGRDCYTRIMKYLNI